MGSIKTTTLDALVVGAGFGGLYQLYTLRNLGLSVKVIDQAGGVGGTWYWNRYPGAMSDSESFVYRYTWDREDLRTYPWDHHYLKGPEIRQYLEHVVNKHDLRKDIQLDTELLSADWDAQENVWRVETSSNEVFVARYLITALGLLSTANLPQLPGLSDFEGQIYHTSRWKDDIDLHGKRVGIIGNGSTGVQVITEVSSYVKSLVSFQRHPQYSVPSGNRPVKPEYRKWVNDNYDDIMDSLPKTATCFGFTESTTSYSSVEPEKREEVFQKLWDQGNAFRFMFGGFSDLGSNKEANEATCNFVKSKISQIVKDPEKARKLMPREPYARRPLCDHGYYAQFNRSNVDLVNLQDTPIDRVTATGIRTTDGMLYEFDVLIMATGFDAVEGSYTRRRFRGRSGETLSDHWKSGPKSYLGCFVPGFPNLLMISGPQGPFTNIPPQVETQAQIHAKLIQQAEELRADGKVSVIEAIPEAEADWGRHCTEIANGTLFPSVKSWIFADVPGATGPIPRFFMGGLAKYREALDAVIQGDCDGFVAPLGNGRKLVHQSNAKTAPPKNGFSEAETVEVSLG
jgi:cyclohexanone monooxygenase